MKTYYLNNQAQSNGDHEVHTEDCSYLPAYQNRIPLGSYVSCYYAVLNAKQRYPSARINGCYYCANSCHTS